MTSNLELLIVEDDEKQIKIYKDAIDKSNENNDEIKIQYTISKNLDDGLQNLRNPDNKFDVAIVDLKLGADDIEGRGKQIIKEIKDNLRFPIVVITGHKDLIGEDLQNQNYLFKIYNRTEKDTKEILNEIIEIYETGLTKILGRKGLIAKYLQEIFWNHIANNIEELSPFLKSSENQEQILLRYILGHLTAYLELNKMGEYEKYNPAEFYIMPPIKNRKITTGDIIKENSQDKYFIVLTPSCDTVIRNQNGETFRNAEYFILSSPVEWNSIENFNELNVDSGKGKKNKLNEFIKNKKERYHFLPPFKNIKGYFIDFQSINSKECESVEKNYTIIAHITKDFLKDIISRFSSYYSRQGQPEINFDVDSLIKSTNQN